MWYVYFLLLSNDDIYVGPTVDLRERFRTHQSGEVRSTRAYRPVSLSAYVAVKTGRIARQLERYFKSGSAKDLGLRNASR
jgi:putative endonuclease